MATFFEPRVRAMTLGENGDSESEGLIPSNVLNPTQARELIKKYKAHTETYLAKQQEAAIKQEVESIGRNAVVSALGDQYDTAAAFEAVDQLEEQFVKEGRMTVSDAAEWKRTMNNWAADYAEERVQTKKKQEKATTLQTYGDFTKKMINNTLTADEIFESNLKEDEKEEWQNIIRGGMAESPEETDYQAYKESTLGILNYALGIDDKKTVLSSLLTKRYVDKSMTDDDFQAAVKRIENPYPKDAAVLLDGVLKDVEQAGGITNGWFASIRNTDQEEYNVQQVSTGLLNWFDRESKDGKYPTLKQMYEKAEELGIAVNVGKAIEEAEMGTTQPQAADFSQYSDEELMKRLMQE